jgi:transposase
MNKLDSFKQSIEQVVYEAGPTGFKLVRALRAEGYCADVVAPSKIPTIPGQETKCDRLDCRKLSACAAKNDLTPIQVPTEQEEADRQIVRLHSQMGKKLRTAKNQIRSFLLQYSIPEPSGIDNWTKRSVEELRSMELKKELRDCLDVMLDELGHAQEQVKRALEMVKELSEIERHKEEIDRFMAVNGVGILTAMTYKTELIAPERFENSKVVARYVGLAPGVSQTGDTRKEGPIMKSGNTRIRPLLVEASWNWVRRDPVARRKYMRLVRNTGSQKKAIVAVARHLSIVLWLMLVKKEKYRPAV